MRPESRKYLWDALHAADRISRFAAGVTFAQYSSDELLRSAIERQFEIVGEALALLRRADPETANAIPELPSAVAFRNILIHGYAVIDDQLVWGVIEGRVPP